MSIENRAMAVVGRVCVVVMAFAVSAIATQAQTLSNGGFESGTPPTPTSWTLFNNAYMVGTNCPGDANNTCTNLTVHSGAYSLKTYGPYSANYDASGAFQDITGVTVGDTWKVSGYALNWSGDPLVGSNGWGMGQIQFLDSTNGIIQVTSPHTLAPIPRCRWISGPPFRRWGRCPWALSRCGFRFSMLGYLAQVAASGSMTLLYLNVQGRQISSGPPASPGIQLSWPTTLAANYQVQTTTNLSPSAFWSNFGSGIIGSSCSNQVFDAFGSSLQNFYRVHTP